MTGFETDSYYFWKYYTHALDIRQVIILVKFLLFTKTQWKFSLQYLTTMD